MNWLGGYSSEWSVYRVDVSTWQDAELIDGVRSIHIERDCSDSVPLLETGTMELDASDFTEGWYRIYLTAKQEIKERVAVATLLFQQSSKRWEKGATFLTAQGWSVLRPAADLKLARGEFLGKGSSGVAFVVNTLSRCIPAPVVSEGDFSLDEHLVFDIGSSQLEAVWKVLEIANWCIMIDGDGTVHVSEKPTEESLLLDTPGAALLIPGIGGDTDLSDKPNRYIAINGSLSATAIIEDEESPISFQKRERWVDLVDTSPALLAGETLQSYAQRRLTEVSTRTITRTYTREFWPGVVPYSMVKGSLPSVGLEGNLRVISQSLECGKGIVLTETSGLEVLP